jgi:hypothetical protein
MNEYMKAMNEWMNERMNESANEWMKGMNEWLSEWMNKEESVTNRGPISMGLCCLYSLHVVFKRNFVFNVVYFVSATFLLDTLFGSCFI